MHSDQFGFFVEWEDTQADLVREYQLSYFVRTDARPNEVSMVRPRGNSSCTPFYMPRAPAKPARCWVFAASRSTSPIRVYGGLVFTSIPIACSSPSSDIPSTTPSLLPVLLRVVAYPATCYLLHAPRFPRFEPHSAHPTPHTFSHHRHHHTLSTT